MWIATPNSTEFFFIILYTLISIVHIFVLYDYSIIEAYM